MAHRVAISGLLPLAVMPEPVLDDVGVLAVPAGVFVLSELVTPAELLAPLTLLVPVFPPPPQAAKNMQTENKTTTKQQTPLTLLVPVFPPPPQAAKNMQTEIADMFFESPSMCNAYDVLWLPIIYFYVLSMFAE